LLRTIECSLPLGDHQGQLNLVLLPRSRQGLFRRLLGLNGVGQGELPLLADLAAQMEQGL
jgi:hypothetical protein